MLLSYSKVVQKIQKHTRKGKNLMFEIHQLLTVVPLWVLVIVFYVGLSAPIQILRNRHEGFPYQVAWSALFGHVGLVGVVLIAATILQRGNVVYYSWFENTIFHSVAIVFSLSVGFVWIMLDRLAERADKYHHIVVAPILTYCMITLFPVILLNGTGIETAAAGFLVLVWALLVWEDAKRGRLDQRTWLKKNVRALFKDR